MKKNLTPESMIEIWRTYRTKSGIAPLAKSLGISTSLISQRATAFGINNPIRASETNRRFELLEHFRNSYFQNDFLEDFLSDTRQTYEQWNGIRRWFNRRGLQIGILRRKDGTVPRLDQSVPMEQETEQVTEATPVQVEPTHFEIFVY